MSRIGNKPIPLNGKVKVELNGKQVTVSGPKATMEHVVPELIDIEIDDTEVRVTRVNDGRQAKSLHGLTRSLVASMVQGVDTGFKKGLEIRGVGYRAAVSGRTLTLNLGYSHPVVFEVPEGITVTVNNNTQVSVEGHDKQQVGQVAATIRGYRKPEPYKGKGIRYVGEYVIQKEGKSV
jgi:large subunit ribosomal protein L6